MSTSITNAFIKQFEAEVQEAYQRRGSKLKPWVRFKGGVIGSSTTFQKVGKGSAATKSRHGQVPVMNVDHGTATATLTDFYAGDWVDKLDELKTNIDERGVVANAGAYALGRKTDDLIIGSLTGGTPLSGGIGAAGGLTKAKILQAFSDLGTRDVPNDGQRYAVVSIKAWSDLLNIEEFASSDYSDGHPWGSGLEVRRWLGINWMSFSGLPVTTAGVRQNFMFHKSAVGLAEGQGIVTDITWHGDRAAHFISNSMSEGSVLIDAAGVTVIQTTET